MRIHAGYNLHRRKKWQERTHGMTREEIHRAEKRLERLDGLRFSLRNHI